MADQVYLQKCTVQFLYYQQGNLAGGSSGFHLGNGWIVTNAHCVNNERGDIHEQFVTSLTEATVTFDGENAFAANTFSAVIFTNISAELTEDEVDLALVHIKELKDFPAVSVANAEQGYLTPSITVHAGPKLEIGMKTACLHYGWNNQNQVPGLQNSESEVIAALNAVDFARSGSTTSGGSSGSPVFTADFKHLIGVHFANGHEASAINASSLKEFMQHSVSINLYLEGMVRFAGSESRVNKQRENLVKFVVEKGYGLHLP